ncbi:MAG TPA: thioesterase family protein [Acidimicrobiales bacterium]|nr:thioesterase family protein [Acidimicrobiales bacterium]
MTPRVTSGANALFGGCATAAALVAASQLTDQPAFWVGVHFGKLAAAGSTVEVRGRVLGAGRTLTHLSVEATAAGAEVFSARITAGRRSSSTVEGHWSPVPDVAGPEESEPFDLPVHDGTWAERFEWRLAAGRGSSGGPVASWWVRPKGERPDPLVTLAVVADYVTYGVGRALGSPMGGLSVDNSLRIHRRELSEWLLLAVRPEAVADGLGFGSAYVYDSERRLLAVGGQTMVVNDWDWRTPAERYAEAGEG